MMIGFSSFINTVEFDNNGLFLYNHAAELHEAKEYERSIAVFERCARYYNDMDVQMLLADNYKETGKLPEAEQHLKMAVAMCPARFMPLYELVKLYGDAGRRDEALASAKKIIDKDVKVSSSTVSAIKKEMRLLIEEQETADEPASADHTLKPSGNEDTRQGETPKVRPNGAALPP
jgi:tetratricopeptide (TPR) repeat protein